MQENYQKEIDQLFLDWKLRKSEDGLINHNEEVFIRDGVICPEQWFSQDVRPLFLCKEAYNGTGDWNLIYDHLLQTQKKMSHMWKRITMWSEGIFNTTKDNVFPFHLCSEQTYFGNEWLQKIAIVNVKKSGGTSRSSMNEINDYAEFDKNFLLREIEICDPTIIVCGYTISSLNRIMGCTVKDYDNPNADWIYSIELNGHKIIVIDYYHPSNQFPDLMNYYGLMNIYQLALINHGM